MSTRTRGHDAGEPVAGRSPDDRLGFGGSVGDLAGQAGQILTVYHPLPSAGAVSDQSALVGPAPYRVDADPEQVGGLAEPVEHRRPGGVIENDIHEGSVYQVKVVKRWRSKDSLIRMRSETPETVSSETFGIDPRAYERRWWTLSLMCLCLVLVVASVSSLNTAIPTLAAELRPTDTQILWIVDAYAVVFAGLLLFAGSLGDRFGRKGALLIGLAIFALASVACSQSTDPNVLIACRAIMGVGAALIMPATLSMLTSVFPPAERPKAIATWAGFAGAGGAIGPIVSGLLLSRFWYGSVFIATVPIAIVAFGLILVLAPNSSEGASTRLDPVGAILSMVGFSSLLFAIIEGPEKGWGSAVVLGGLVAAVVGIGGFIVWERRRTNPMLDMSLFANRRFSVSAGGIAFTFMAMFSLFFVLSQYLQYVRGYSALRAGVAGVPFAVTMIVVSPRAATVAQRFGVRRTVAGALLTVSLGLALFSLNGRTTPYVYVAFCLVVMGAGMATAMPSMTSGIMSAVPRHMAGVGSAVNDTSRELGGAIGIAIVGSIVSAVYRSDVRPALTSLPPEAAEQVLKNVGRASRVADQVAQTVGPDAANGLTSAVRDAFVNGAQTGLRVVALLAVLTAAVVAWQHPAGVGEPSDDGH